MYMFGFAAATAINKKNSISIFKSAERMRADSLKSTKQKHVFILVYQCKQRLLSDGTVE